MENEIRKPSAAECGTLWGVKRNGYRVVGGVGEGRRSLSGS